MKTIATTTMSTNSQGELVEMFAKLPKFVQSIQMMDSSVKAIK